MQYSSGGSVLHLFFAANPKKPATFQARQRLMEVGRAHGFLCDEIETQAPAGGEKGVIVVIGGDGSIIRQVPTALAYDMPLLGIHFGRVGFLTELQEDSFADALQKIKSGSFHLEQRSMLECTMQDGALYRCLNDAVLYKRSFSGVTEVDVCIDGKLAWCFSGDGVVVSTPTGSTGYNLSAGGPIVPEGVDALVITPICPHKLHVRPIVVSSGSKVELMEHDEGMAAMDGEWVGSLEKGGSLCITGSKQKVSFVRLQEMDLYSRISNRLS